MKNEDVKVSISIILRAIGILTPLIVTGFAMYFTLQYTTRRVECIEKRMDVYQDTMTTFKTDIVGLKKDIEYIKSAVDELRRNKR